MAGKYSVTWFYMCLLILLFILSACGEDEPGIDGDIENDTSEYVENDIEDDTEIDTDEYEADNEIEADNFEVEDESDEEESVVTRMEISQGSGYCKTTGDVLNSCQTKADCRPYRTPISTNCMEPMAEHLFDCSFAKVGELPADMDDVCTADSYCNLAPVDCIDNKCFFDLPNDNCETDSDCTYIDKGCFCFPVNKNVTEFDSGYGSECDDKTACPTNATTICVYGKCRVVGPHLDDNIDDFCKYFYDNVPVYADPERCVDHTQEDYYKDAAILQRSIEVHQEFINMEFSDFLNGPWFIYQTCFFSK